MVRRSRLPFPVAAAVLMIVASAPALAGEVYGRVTMAGVSVGSGATVAARCGEKSYPAKPTDKSGSYHLIVGESGKCSLVITCKDASASLDIVSYEDAVQIDVDLEMKDGKLAARRR